MSSKTFYRIGEYHNVFEVGTVFKNKLAAQEETNLTLKLKSLLQKTKSRAQSGRSYLQRITDKGFASNVNP